MSHLPMSSPLQRLSSLQQTTSEASLTAIEFTTEVSTTDALPTITTIFIETVSSVESNVIASTTTTSPAEAPIYTNLVKNGDFRLMYSLYEAQATSYSCDLTMFVRGKRVAQKRVAGDLGTWVPLEGEVDMDAGEGDLIVTFEYATRGSFFMTVDRIVVSDEASLEDLIA